MFAPARQCSRQWIARSFRDGVGKRSMSVRPEETKRTKEGDVAPRKKVTIQRLQHMRDAGTPIAMLTAYDYPTGRACETYGVDISLVGDSLAQVCLGYDSTTRLTMDEMLPHCRAVSRGSRNPLLVADMPFGSYYAGLEDAVRAGVRMVREGHVEAVKMEGGEEIVPSVRALTSMGIPVMAHVGLLPQRHTAYSGYRVQGKDVNSARAVLRAALALEDAGAFSMVLEAVPHHLGTYITQRLRVPTIGIGAGPGTSGQVLVWNDVMATWNGHKAKFVRRFADVQGETKKGVIGYIDAVKDRSFPDASESYEMEAE
ncbi:ketopantoate hydroxymethyltransferase, partial [Rickenella mellea]